MFNNKGLSSVESGVLLSALIVAIVGMSVYLQRGMKGGLFQSSQSVGLQFDPEDDYWEEKTLRSNSTSVESAGAPYDFWPVLTNMTPTKGPFSSGAGAGNWSLVSLFNAAVPRSPSSWSTSSSDSSSRVIRDAEYHVTH
jgi:hypothetical protein